MELFDVYDKNRKPLGYTKVRGEILEDNERNIGVELFIFNDNKLLLTQRSINKTHPGKWEVPGGCSQTGESPIDTLIREVKEEIGVTITKNDCEFITTQMYKYQFVDVYKSNIKVDLAKVVLQEEEVSDIKFVTEEEFLQMLNNDEIVEYISSRYNLIENKLKKDW